MTEITKYAPNEKPSGPKEFFITDNNDIMLARYSKPLNIDPTIPLFNLKTKTGNITTNAKSVGSIRVLQSATEYKKIFGGFAQIQNPVFPKTDKVSYLYVNTQNIATAVLAGQILDGQKVKDIYLVTCNDKTTFFSDSTILNTLVAPK